MRIIPTNGRVMLYHPGNDDSVVQHDKAQPLTAHVCHVWGEDMVNVMVIDSTGEQRPCSSVPIVQDGSPWTAGASPYLTWMSYQIGQAKKHAEADVAKLA